jgi:hypothetical protein
LVVFVLVAGERKAAHAAGATVTVAISPLLDRHPVSPMIYGANLATDRLGAVPYPVNRWGGNATSLYSWKANAANLGTDWYFINTPYATAAGATLPDGSMTDVFVQGTRAAGSIPLLTVPMIGWTAKSNTKLWSFSVAKYGQQTASECSSGVPSCSSDAGNGLSAPGGQPVVGNDPNDASAPIGPSFVTDWMAHLAAKFGSAAAGGVRYYMLDNEVTLWSSTHRDVHPAPVTYDELWSRTQQYAGAIKAADPAAKTMGPSAWGWCAYYYSGKDGCTSGADSAAHGNVPLLAWYLQQNCAAGMASGTKPVDWLDIHYYPQAANVVSSDESAATVALRLRSLKSLYDPAYVDESWIGSPVQLVPQMKQLIATNCPGMSLSVSEYSWGADDSPSAAVAHAEALAIFGREGVDLAARGSVPAAGTRVEDAFKLFLDYDGAGGKVAGSSVRAVSSNVDVVGSYAIAGSTQLYVLLFNKATTDTAVSATIAGSTANAAAQAFRFDPSHPLGPAAALTVSSGAFGATLPAMSATLIVIPLAPAVVPVGVSPIWLGLGLLVVAASGYRARRFAPRPIPGRARTAAAATQARVGQTVANAAPIWMDCSRSCGDKIGAR